MEQVFCIPIKAVELQENDMYPRKLRILAENAAHVNFTISFTATRKKKQFMDVIRTQRSKPNRER